MSSIYERTDIYDLFEDKSHLDAYQKHWKKLLQGKNIHTLLDVSIGSGSVTLPAATMGIDLYGSDLSSEMIKKCRDKAKRMGCQAELKCCDFRDLSCWKNRKFDCVASTGNSLPHVDNEDFFLALEAMDAVVNPGGYLYFDMRNWDKIQKERNRFYLYNPVFIEKSRVNLVQVWDYNRDGSMTFNLLYTFEKENKIYQKEKFEETYYPISRQAVIGHLKSTGYEELELNCFPACFEVEDIENADWYSIIAKKGK